MQSLARASASAAVKACGHLRCEPQAVFAPEALRAIRALGISQCRRSGIQSSPFHGLINSMPV